MQLTNGFHIRYEAEKGSHEGTQTWGRSRKKYASYFVWGMRFFWYYFSILSKCSVINTS